MFHSSSQICILVCVTTILPLAPFNIPGCSTPNNAIFCPKGLFVLRTNITTTRYYFPIQQQSGELCLLCGTNRIYVTQKKIVYGCTIFTCVLGCGSPVVVIYLQKINTGTWSFCSSFMRLMKCTMTNTKKKNRARDIWHSCINCSSLLWLPLQLCAL
jgi:hypothetical protein